MDGNGVDLATGVLIVNSPELTIGHGEGALAYIRNIVGGGWLDNVTGTINTVTNAGVTTATVSFGGASESFTSSGGAYANAQGGGSTLSLSGTIYTYTTAAGAAVLFDSTIPAYPLTYANGGRPTKATYPDGLVVTFTYQTGSNGTQNVSRLSSVNNNLGYQLKLTYESNDPTNSF